LAVEDTGIGIPPEQLGRIFERFTQADDSLTRKYGGTGIGLAFAREIVALHGGRITVTSTVGVGSRFVVHMRRGEKHFAEQVVDRRAPGGAGDPAGKRAEDQGPQEWALRIQSYEVYRFGELSDVTDRRRVPRGPETPLATRVLVVEDNVEILKLITLQLQAEHTLYVAQDGRQGLELAKRELPDVIVTDLMMPEMDGLTMLSLLRSDPATAQIPVIMLTAKNAVEDRVAAREAGADVYLSKPFSPRELSVAVRGLLEKRGRHVGQIIRAQLDSLESISAGLAHEIHNPLNFVKSAQQLLGESLEKIWPLLAPPRVLPPDDQAAVEKARTRIEKVMKAAEHGVRRIERVVALVRRYAREGYPSEMIEVPFDPAVSDVVSLLIPEVNAEDVVTLDLGAKGGAVRCIPEEMHQVIRCLVQNAVDAVGGNGRVLVRSRRDRGHVLFDVIDNGPGITPENRTKIFSPLFTTKASGMGMGLAIVSRVVTRSGGTVEVDSKPGERTTFRVRLPDVSATPAPRPDRGAGEAPVATA
jgi:signal transduction histidine kinase